jgi:hypothetical protein
MKQKDAATVQEGVSVRFELANHESNSKHANHKITEGDISTLTDNRMAEFMACMFRSLWI